jgi:hypothetical protein
MSMRGKWRVVETPEYDMAGAGSYILFNEGQFTWEGNDEMEEANGHGWAELQHDGSLEGEIFLENGDEIPFIARRSTTSSTAC